MLRFAACFFCQGSSLRSDKRKLRGLDSACGEAPGTARKGFVFCAAKCRCAKGKNPQSKGANNATRTCRVVFPARQFRQGLPPTVGGRARPMVCSSAMGATGFRLADRCEDEWHQLRGSEACLRPHPSRENRKGVSSGAGDCKRKPGN